MARPLVTDELARYNEAKTERSKNENDWRMSSAYCLPRHYSAWTHEGVADYGNQGAAQARRIAYDSTGVLALPKYAAILERLCTPYPQRWHGLTSSNKDLMRSYRVRMYFDQLTELLFEKRYVSRANFRQSAAEVYTSMGCYGTGPIYLGQRTPNALSRAPSLLYKACPLRDIFVLLNDEGEIDTVFRRFFLNVRQFKQKFPDMPLPKSMATSVANGAQPKESDYKEFIHVVHPRTDYDPSALDSRRHPIVGSYISVADQEYVGEEHGFRSMPYLTPRTFTEAGNPYGFSPAQQALAAMGSASAMKKTNLRQGQKAADPVLLAHDDGVMNGGVDLRPGAINYGGVDKQGRRMIMALETGNFQVSRDLLTDERRDVNDSFFVNLFQILIETPEMTATEVVERTAEKSALLAPTMGRLQSELLGPMIEREIDVLDEMGLLPELPPELREAQGEYQVVYTSPMAKGMYAEEVSGFMRAVEMAMNVANATQNPEYLDHFNFNTAIPEISNFMAVPARWMNGDKEKQQLKDTRDQKVQEQQVLQNAAPIAGALKAAQQMQQGNAK